MIYAMSDIHAHYRELYQRLDQLGNLETVCSGPDRLIFLGDYIDRGPESYKVLYLLSSLQQSCPERIIVLRGNHEEMLLEWLDTYTGPGAGKPDEHGLIPWNPWLNTDRDYQTFRTFLTGEQWGRFQQLLSARGEEELNREAAEMLLESHRPLIDWLRQLPYYYETETQIFVHAGVDEEAGEYWKWGAEDRQYTEKHPASRGHFYKDIIAGHLGTSRLAGDPKFHDIYWDGESHYYIDGTVVRSGFLPVLAYEEKTRQYYTLGPYVCATGRKDIHQVRGELRPIRAPGYR